MILEINQHEFYMEWEDLLLNQNQPAVLIFTGNILRTNPRPSYVEEIEKACEENCVRGLLFQPEAEIDLLVDLGISTLPRVVIIKDGGRFLHEDPWTDLDKIIEAIKNL